MSSGTDGGLNAMPEWALNVNAAQAKARLQLSKIEDVAWERTTFPKLPESIRTLPISVTLSVTDDGIQIVAKRVGFYSKDEEACILLPKAEIVGIDIVLKPKAEEDYQGNIDSDDCSRAFIRLRDRFEVVPFFENTFSAIDPYWMRALAKIAKERLGMEATIREAGC